MLRIDPSNAIVCFHRQLSAAFIPFCPWRSACFSRFQILEQINSHTTSTVHTHTQHFYKILFIHTQNSIHSHTQELNYHSLYIYLLSFISLGRCWYKEIFLYIIMWMWSHIPETSQLFRPVSGHRFLVGDVYRIILSFFLCLSSIFLWSSCCFVAICLSCFFSFHHNWLSCIKGFVYVPEHLLVSEECLCVFACKLTLTGEFTEKKKMQLCYKSLLQFLLLWF